jgi:alkylmercury lyase
MENGPAKLGKLIAALMEVFPELDDTKRRIALATYRRLALGVPASPEEIAGAAGVEVERVRSTLDDWIGVYTDEQKRVVGFWGLAIPKMKHRFEVDGIWLHAWCAWDTLFLPELLGKTARVESTCGTSGQPVHLTVSPVGVLSAEPRSLVVSFLDPVASRFQQDIIQNFCCYIHFFRSSADGEAWIAKNPGTFLLTLEEAVELARLWNEAQFGGHLESRR